LEKRTELFNRHVLPHRNLVYKLCIEYSRSASDVEDNYNEVLINFFKYIETYDQARSIQTWLHIVTKRLVRDLNHRNGAFRRSDDVDVAEIAGSIPDEAVAGGMNADDCCSPYGDEVLEALNSLKPIYRETLLLQQAGYRLHEIMEISYRNGNLKTKNLETVKSRLFLARQQMRQLVTRDGKRKKN
jgi:DNA-directed RNA polymerase specialized sigma24 family protein